mmetsp:Transcript_29433/g.57780  ORF Transcript_29433/g.57780 Transcript_29433/m.57780 type:complete len:107 (-) Transcript_29433:252-572(-)
MAGGHAEKEARHMCRIPLSVPSLVLLFLPQSNGEKSREANSQDRKQTKQGAVCLYGHALTVTRGRKQRSREWVQNQDGRKERIENQRKERRVLHAHLSAHVLVCLS